jgi:hypothetical protein
MLEVLADVLRNQLKATILAMEYPGYSLYNEKNASTDGIKTDAKALIEFLKTTLDIPLSSVTIIGRSLGSGPAIYLGSLYRFRAITIVSGFLSVKEVVRERAPFLGRLFDSYFDNGALIHLNRSPILLLHGKNDTMTGCWQSERLYEKCTSKAKIIVFENMAHNDFNYGECVLVPLKNFLENTMKQRKAGGAEEWDDRPTPASRLTLRLTIVFGKKIFNSP